MNELGAAGIGAAGSIAGNLVQNAVQDIRDKKARQFQLKMMQYQNQYNSPSAMMARMSQAGINPNLLAGQPIEPASNGVSPAQGSKSANFDDVVTSSLSAASAVATLKQQREQTKLIAEEARAKKLENDAKENNYPVTTYDAEGNPTFEYIGNYYEASAQLELNAKSIQNSLNEYEIAPKSLESLVANTQIFKGRHELISDIRFDVLSEQLENIRKNGRLTEEQINLVRNQAQVLWSDMLEAMIAKDYLIFEDGVVIGVSDEYKEFRQTTAIIDNVLGLLGSAGQLLMPFIQMFNNNAQNAKTRKQTNQPHTKTTSTHTYGAKGNHLGSSVTTTTSN